ncbi:MAG: HEAT repeat domain-containing protein [Candidatus Omnitrophica bacterium]|nr:HEAT repeat domain-containing protein [Candidatus Omnitrophota bacterium]
MKKNILTKTILYAVLLCFIMREVPADAIQVQTIFSEEDLRFRATAKLIHDYIAKQGPVSVWDVARKLDDGKVSVTLRPQAYTGYLGRYRSPYSEEFRIYFTGGRYLRYYNPQTCSSMEGACDVVRYSPYLCSEVIVFGSRQEMKAISEMMDVAYFGYFSWQRDKAAIMELVGKLAKTRDPRSVQPLTFFFRIEDAALHEYLLALLRWMGAPDEAIVAGINNALREELSHGGTSKRLSLLLTDLSSIRHESVIPVAAQLLGWSSEDVNEMSPEGERAESLMRSLFASKRRFVDELVRCLEDPIGRIRADAVIALKWYASKDDADAIIRAAGAAAVDTEIENDDWALMAASDLLERIEATPEQMTVWWKTMLRSRSAKMRSAALDKLGGQDAARDEEALLLILQNNLEGWEKAAQALLRSGTPAERVITALLDYKGPSPQSDETLMKKVDFVVSLHDISAVTPILLVLSTTEQDTVRAKLSDAFRELRLSDDDLFRQLCASVRSPDERLRAVAAAEMIRTEQSVPVLIGLLDDPSPDVRIAAAGALGLFHKARAAIQPMIERFDRQPPAVKEEFIAALGYIHENNAADADSDGSVDLLIRALDDESRGVSEWAILSLASIKTRRAVPRLIELLDHDCLEINDKAASALGKIGDTAALEPLIKRYNAEFKYPSGIRERDAFDAAWAANQYVQRTAVEAVAAIGGPAGIAFMRTIEHDIYGVGWRTALLTLVSARDEELEPLLRGFLGHDDIPSDHYDVVFEALEAMGDEKALAILFEKAADFYDRDISDAPLLYDVLRTIGRIIRKNTIVIHEDMCKKIIVNMKFAGLAYLFNEFPEYFDKMLWGGGTLRKLLARLNEEAAGLPPSARESFLRTAYELIDNIVVTRRGAPLFERADYKERCYKEIVSLLNIVHADINTCLNSIGNLRVLRMSDNDPEIDIFTFQPLREALPIKDPLTTIIGALGEHSWDNQDGCFAISERLIQAGRFHDFLAFAVSMMRRYGRRSPQNVIGALQILGSFRGFEKWGAEKWNESFLMDFEGFFQAGFKVITPRLFDIYRANKGDREALESLKKDVDELLGPRSLWGNYFGCGPDIQAKWGLTDDDELGLIAKYMPLHAKSIHAYLPEFREVKSAIRDRNAWSREKGQPLWQEEVDGAVRTLFSLHGTEDVVAYTGTDKDKRHALHERLKGLASGDGIFRPALQKYIDEPSDDTWNALKVLCVKYAVERARLPMERFSVTPGSDSSCKQWLDGWLRLVTDTWRQDCRADITAMIADIIVGRPYASLRGLSEAYKKSYRISVDSKNELFKADNEAAALVKNAVKEKQETVAALAGYFARTWFSRIDEREIRDASLIGRWAGRGLAKYVKALLKKNNVPPESAAETAREYAAIVQDALDRARNETLDALDAEDAVAGRKKILAEAVSLAVMDIFKEEESAIRDEIGLYTVGSVETQEEFYVGFFDDLFHLMGFMMSGVCTFDYRARQVLWKTFKAEDEEDFHFGKLAVKNRQGKVMALSQVQLVRCPVEGMEQKRSPKGWSAMILPGINFEAASVPLSKNAVVLSILETAQRLAEKSGMQCAAIPCSNIISSNYAYIWNEIIGLVASVDSKDLEGVCNDPAGLLNELEKHGYISRIGTNKGTKQYVLESTVEDLKSAGDLALSGAFRDRRDDIFTVLKTIHDKAWLKKRRLSAEIVLSKGHVPYSYRDVYVIDIPHDAYALAETSLDDHVNAEERDERRVLRESTLPFGDGFGEIAWDEGAVSRAVVDRVKSMCEELLGELPAGMRDLLRTKISKGSLAVTVTVDRQYEKSVVMRKGTDIEMVVGRDVLYAEGMMEEITFIEMFAELETAIVAKNYTALKQNAPANENAYFKLNILKMLFAIKHFPEMYYKYYSMRMNNGQWLPASYLSGKSAEAGALCLEKSNEDLEKFMKGIDAISQWNVFLNVMDDADPRLLVLNYAYILFDKYYADGGQLADIMAKILVMPVQEGVSLAALRNVFKEFMNDGKVSLRMDHNGTVQVSERRSFAHFDATQMLAEIKRRIAVPESQNTFYAAVQEVLEYALPVSQAMITSIVTEYFIDAKVYEEEYREAAVGEALKRVFKDYFSPEAFQSIEEHLTAKRFRVDEATGAVEYPPIPYIAVETAYVDSAGRRDWVHDLFVLPGEDPPADEDGPYGDIVRGDETLLVKLLGEQSAMARIGGLRDKVRLDELAGIVRERVAENRGAEEVTGRMAAIERALSDLTALPAVEFDGIVRREAASFLLGFRSSERDGLRPVSVLQAGLMNIFRQPTLGYARNVIDAILLERDHREILAEYVFHEALCHYAGHSAARAVQEALFAKTNYAVAGAEGKRGHRDGRLAEIIKNVLSRDMDGGRRSGGQSDGSAIVENAGTMMPHFVAALERWSGSNEPGPVPSDENGQTHVLVINIGAVQGAGTREILSENVMNALRQLTANNGAVCRMLRNMRIIVGSGESLSGRLSRMRIKPENAVIITPVDELGLFAPYQGRSSITAFDDSALEIRGKQGIDYVPLVEMAFFAVLRNSFGKDGPADLAGLWKWYSSIPNADTLGMHDLATACFDESGNPQPLVIIKLIPKIKRFDYDTLSELYKTISAIVQSA